VHILINSKIMSNFFNDVLGNLDNVEQDLLGPDYKYFKQIKTPSEMGVTSEGGLGHLSDDISGLIAYVQLLVSGGGDASVTGKPLGNKFFLKTGAKCKVVSSDSTNGNVVDRYAYVNNVPDGNIPFISAGLGGVQFTAFEGLIPGTMSDMAGLNPFALFQAFQMGSTPDCQSITLETIDANNNVSSATNYVATIDLANMPASWFPNKVNPITGATEREAFTQRRRNNKCTNKLGSIPNGTLSSLYYTSLGFLCLVLLCALTKRMNNK
jgi:hypothetical protein